MGIFESNSEKKSDQVQFSYFGFHQASEECQTEIVLTNVANALKDATKYNELAKTFNYDKLCRVSKYKDFKHSALNRASSWKRKMKL